MRRACVSTVRSPSPMLLPPQPGGGRVGRSTVSPQHADPSAARDTPKITNIISQINLSKLYVKKGLHE
ncbi:MAG: hypothetical protein NZ455_04755 [Bacteroidia bacterium]|nr:hypothetical protein [Bacteroidia bacterium]MDW8345981.1 hypothetical protein [Bacteroidia bacterium]